MSAPELKPCPFCGGRAELIAPHDGSNPYVMCVDNHCTQPHPDCVVAWNTRADLCAPLTDPRVTALVEAVVPRKRTLQEVHDHACAIHEARDCGLLTPEQAEAVLAALRDLEQGEG